MKINKASIQQQLINGEVKEAIDNLLELTDKFDPSLKNSVIMQSANYNNLQKDIMNGIAGQNADTKMAKLRYQVNMVVNMLKSDWEMEVEGAAPAPTQANTGTATPASPVVEEGPVKNLIFLAANPKGTEALRSGEEVQKIKESLRGEFDMDTVFAVTIDRLEDALYNFEDSPCIVHFSCHGTEEGNIQLEDELGNEIEIEPAALGNLFGFFTNVKCVVLNACHSKKAASEIAKNVGFVVGMNNEVYDQVSINFSDAFYKAVARGKSYNESFRRAQNRIQMKFGMIDLEKNPEFFEK